MRLPLNRFVVCSMVALALTATAFANRGVTPEDYLALQFLSDPRISPDGKEIAYVVTVIDQQKNRRTSSVWLVPSDGHASPRRLTAEGFSSNSPRWSPDGSRLAFLSTRNGDAPTAPGSEPPHAQIFVLPMDGGEAQPVSHLKNGASSFSWSPDGRRFVSLSVTGPMDAVPPAGRKSDVRHYKQILYKFNDTGWFDDKRSHIWVIDAATGADRQITFGDDWNDRDPQWSPDGTRIAFVSDRIGHELDDSQNKDIWVVSADGGEPTK